MNSTFLLFSSEITRL